MAISGQTISQFHPTGADKGKAITVKVTGTRAGYATATVESAPVTIG